jgi:hypothetical protein
MWNFLVYVYVFPFIIFVYYNLIVVGAIPYSFLFVICDIMWQFCKIVLHLEFIYEYFVVIIFPVQYDLHVSFIDVSYY